MSRATLLLILVSVSLSALAQVLFKLGVGGGAAGGSPFAAALAMLLRPTVIGGLALYGVGTVLWLFVLGRTELSQAYPFVAIGFVLTALLGRLIFGDALGPMRIAGIAFVVLGVLLVARS